MKTIHTENYYRDHWNDFIKRVPGEHYMNLEEDFSSRMKLYEGLPEAAIEVGTKHEAQKIAKAATEKLVKTMQVVNGIEAGKQSLGYTTDVQEIKARYEFRSRFEFNCLQLADFRKNHNV